MTGIRAHSRRGSALLAVMWFSAALSAIAFTLSMTVRTELDRAGLNVDQTRAYFLAQGAIEIAAKRMLDRAVEEEEFADQGFAAGQRAMEIPLPGGMANVEIIGNSGKLNIRTVPPEVLAQLLTASGAEPGRAVSVAGRIAELRKRNRRGERSAEFSSLPPSFSLSGSSFQQIEELLLVPGMTPELLYGSFVGDRDGNLIHVDGLYHQVTMRGSGAIDANYASPALLEAAGLPPGEIERIRRMRGRRPLSKQDFPNLKAPNEGFKMGFGGQENHFTLWSTAELANGQTRRTVGAELTRSRQRSPLGFQIVRWFDAPF